MAVRSISVTDTLETFRTQFNELAANDFGDIATLDSSLSATSVIGAVNELSAQVSASLGIFIEDASSTRQQIGAGQTMFIFGTSNEIEAVVSATDTLTIGLPNDVTISNDLTVTNDMTAVSGLFGSTLTIASGSITDTGGTINFGDDIITTTGNITGATGSFSSISSSGAISGTTITGTGDISTSEQFVLTGAAKGIVFEGSVADANELTLKANNPSADVVVTIPTLGANANLVTTGDTGTVTSTMILNGTIKNEDIQDSTIRAAKLNLSADTLVVDTLSANTITGTASVAQLVELNANNTANETVYLTFADGATGNQGLETDTNLTYNPSTNILSTTATAAQYADLAEKYSSDEEYLPGTVVMFGGDNEITLSDNMTNRIAGVISTDPGYVMNDPRPATGEDYEDYEYDPLDKAVALTGRVPCKVIGRVEKGDIVAWLDADTILWERFDEIAYGNYDIGVTVRQPKQTENDLPINAGVVFVRKTRNAEEFVKQWIELCETGVSDQVELNKLAQVSSNDANSTVQRGKTKIQAFECNVYNNFYFKKTQLHAKIIHYKSKHRFRWPERTVKKIPKGYTGDRSPYVETK